jgi:hypothetical protein
MKAHIGADSWDLKEVAPGCKEHEDAETETGKKLSGWVSPGRRELRVVRDPDLNKDKLFEIKVHELVHAHLEGHGLSSVLRLETPDQEEAFVDLITPVIVNMFRILGRFK